MREKNKLLFIDFEKATANLKIAVDNILDELDVDGCIKRFELCYELSWKLIKDYLAFTGINCKNPRDCFKAAKENGIIQDELAWLKMIDDRNYLVPVYTHEQSRSIFNTIKSQHAKSLFDLCDVMKAYYSF